MSYIVELTNIRPQWFVNAWLDSFQEAKRKSQSGQTYPVKYLIDGFTDITYHWNHVYPDCVYKDDAFGEKVTFPDEQTYTWFLLRWS